MSVRLEAVPDRGLKIRTVQPKSGRMATLLAGCIKHILFAFIYLILSILIYTVLCINTILKKY